MHIVHNLHARVCTTYTRIVLSALIFVLLCAFLDVAIDTEASQRPTTTRPTAAAEVINDEIIGSIETALVTVIVVLVVAVELVAEPVVVLAVVAVLLVGVSTARSVTRGGRALGSTTEVRIRLEFRGTSNEAKNIDGDLVDQSVILFSCFRVSLQTILQLERGTGISSFAVRKQNGFGLARRLQSEARTKPQK